MNNAMKLKNHSGYLLIAGMIFLALSIHSIINIFISFRYGNLAGWKWYRYIPNVIDALMSITTFVMTICRTPAKKPVLIIFPLVVRTGVRIYWFIIAIQSFISSSSLYTHYSDIYYYYYGSTYYSTLVIGIASLLITVALIGMVILLFIAAFSRKNVIKPLVVCAGIVLISEMIIPQFHDIIVNALMTVGGMSSTISASSETLFCVIAYICIALFIMKSRQDADEKRALEDAAANPVIAEPEYPTPPEEIR